MSEINYTLETKIDVPRDKVIEYFDNAENMKHWQEGLVGYEHLEGEPGQEGAKTRLDYQMGKRKIEMTETILVRNLPDEFTGRYETDGGYSVVKNRFEALSDSRTRWISDNRFKCDGWFMIIMSKIMPGAFKKQSQKYVDQFKSFAEEKYQQSQ